VTPSAISKRCARTRDAYRRSALHPHHAQLGLTEAASASYRAQSLLSRSSSLPVKSRVTRATAGRTFAPLSAAAVVPILLEPLIASVLPGLCPEVEVENRCKRGTGDLRPMGRCRYPPGPVHRARHDSRPADAAVPLVVVGSPDYLRTRSVRERAFDDLRQHACLRMRRSNGSIAPCPLSTATGCRGNRVGPLIAHDYPHAPRSGAPRAGLAQCPPAR